MNNTYIIGDSHVERMHDSVVDEKIKNLYFISYDGKSGYGVKYDNLQLTENDIIIVCFGYIDVKVKLPEFKNTSIAVKTYVDKTLNFFSNNQIIFTEPFPQFIEKAGNGFPLYDIDLRYKYHTEYVNELNKYVGLSRRKTLSLSNIIGSDKLDSTYQYDVLDDHMKINLYSDLVHGILNKI